MIMPCRSCSGVREELPVTLSARQRLVGRASCRARSPPPPATWWCPCACTRRPAGASVAAPIAPAAPARISRRVTVLAMGPSSPVRRATEPDAGVNPRPAAGAMIPAQATRAYAALNARRAPMISSDSGNRCSACFEKIILPSATTSKIPLVPSISSVSRPSALLDLGRQTGGPGEVLSTGAVRDRQLHRRNSCDSVYYSLRQSA